MIHKSNRDSYRRAWNHGGMRVCPFDSGARPVHGQHKKQWCAGVQCPEDSGLTNLYPYSSTAPAARL